MIRRLVYIVGVCLLFAGCSVLGQPVRDSSGGLQMFPTRFGSRAEKDDLIEAVKKDPFPEAGEVNLEA